MAAAGTMSGVLNVIPSGAPPTVFEVVMQQTLVAGFRPAFDYVLDATIVPLVPRLVHLLAHKDEIWCLLHLIVERSYLRATRSTVAESWYGMWRMPAAGTALARQRDVYGPLSRWAMTWSLVDTVLLPYVVHKLDTLYPARLQWTLEAPDSGRVVIPVTRQGPADGGDRRPDVADATHRHTPRTPWWRSLAALAHRLIACVRTFACRYGRRAVGHLLRVWPRVRAAIVITQTVYLWAFAFGASKVHSPFLRLAGVRLARLSGDHLKAIQQTSEAVAAAPAAAAATATASGRVLHALGTAQALAGSAVKYGVVIGFVGLKAAEWWFSNEEELQPVRNGGACLVPPAPSAIEQRGPVAMPRRKGECPLCRKPIANPTASTAGVVYCFVCINGFVGKHGMCPVAGQQCRRSDLRTIRDF